MITCVLGGQSTLFLEGLRAALSREPRITVGESATDPSGMVRMVRASSPDVVVLTYEPPRLSIEVAQAVRPVPALMLTWSPRVQDAAAALRAGVQGFLVKDAPERQIHAAVRAVGTGCLSYPREYGDILSLVGASGPGSPPALTLTEREQAIVELVAEGLTSQQIATRLGIAPQTVKNHVNNAMHKVGVNSRLQLAAWAGQRLPTTTHGPGARSLGRPSGAPGGVNAARGVASRQEL